MTQENKENRNSATHLPQLNEDQNNEAAEQLKLKEQEVENVICALRNSKIPDADGILKVIYKRGIHVWTPYITRLFKECTSQNIFPTPWKQANVINLLKR